jgi:hypothetical protein
LLLSFLSAVQIRNVSREALKRTEIQLLDILCPHGREFRGFHAPRGAKETPRLGYSESRKLRGLEIRGVAIGPFDKLNIRRRALGGEAEAQMNRAAESVFERFVIKPDGGFEWANQISDNVFRRIME